MLNSIKSFFGLYYDLRKIPLKEKILFVHIPKNGGTSVIKALGISNVTHTKAIEYIDINKEFLLTGRFSFSIVRNPYERFISLYNYARMEISHYHNNLNPEMALNGKHLDFEILKNKSIDECAMLLIEGKLKHDNTWNQWEPQHTWVYCGNKLKVKKVYKLEKLNELSNDLKKYFGEDIIFPTLNKSSGVIKSKNLSKKTKKIIQEYYSKDFEYFKYPI